MSYINPFLIPDIEHPEDRSFIDLSFDGVTMSELGLIIIFDGNSTQQVMTPQFTNNVTSIPGRDGVIFWKTDIGVSSVTKKLGTDCMTSRQYNRLRQLLKPGKIAKLILAQRPYCYAWAFLQGPPVFNFVPFDKKVYINGTEYTDVVYKGSCNITWNIIDGHWYGQPQLATLTGYQKQPWIFQSGLPLKAQSDVIFASNQYSEIETPTSFKVYNSGTHQSKVSLKLQFSAGQWVVLSDNTTNWTDITIYSNTKLQTIINKPRLFKDVEYFYALLKSIPNLNQNNFEQHKAQILNNLRDNLDSNSAWREQLIFMTQATFNSGGKYDLTTLKTAVSQLFNSASFSFLIDGINKQMVMKVEYTGTNWQDQDANQQTERKSVQNIEGVSNGIYITIDGNYNLMDNFVITPIPMNIHSIQVPKKAQIFFLNEYA